MPKEEEQEGWEADQVDEEDTARPHMDEDTLLVMEGSECNG